MPADWTGGYPGFVFDTSVLIDAWHSDKDRGPFWRDIDRDIPHERRWVCTVSLHEVLQGQPEQPKRDVRLAQHKWVVERFQLLPLDDATDGQLRKYHELAIDLSLLPPLKSLGDWLIAAAAQSRDLALVSRETKDTLRPLVACGLVLLIPPAG